MSDLSFHEGWNLALELLTTPWRNKRAFIHKNAEQWRSHGIIVEVTRGKCTLERRWKRKGIRVEFQRGSQSAGRYLTRSRVTWAPCELITYPDEIECLTSVFTGKLPEGGLETFVLSH